MMLGKRLPQPSEYPNLSTLNAMQQVVPGLEEDIPAAGRAATESDR